MDGIPGHLKMMILDFLGLFGVPFLTIVKWTWRSKGCGFNSGMKKHGVMLFSIFLKSKW